jgi:predicted RNA polymerase sigma factor
MCCHPALSPASAIALTLRAVGGLTTAEIAKAFLVPDAGERAERLGSVLHVLYLVFNEGYTTSAGPGLQPTHLSGEAIRLTRRPPAPPRRRRRGRAAGADAPDGRPPCSPHRPRRGAGHAR